MLRLALSPNPPRPTPQDLRPLQCINFRTEKMVDLGGKWVANAVYAYRRLLAAQQFHRLEESRDGPPQRGSVRGTKCPTDFALANMFTSAAAVLTFIFSRI